MLTDDMLRRLKDITDLFEEIDGISYEAAVKANDNDRNPESEISILEEMARVYKEFCKTRPLTLDERKEVYRILLLRSFYDEYETIMRMNIQELAPEEAKLIISKYKLESKPAVLYCD